MTTSGAFAVLAVLVATGPACGTTPAASPPSPASDSVFAPAQFDEAARDQRLSPAKLPDLRGIQFGMGRQQLLARLASAGVGLDERDPLLPSARMPFDGQPARWVFCFDRDRLFSVSILLRDIPAAPRRAVFDRHAEMLKSAYGKPGVVDEDAMVIQWDGGWGGVMVAFIWHEPVQVFELLFTITARAL